jgi:competence protein ComEA
MATYSLKMSELNTRGDRGYQAVNVNTASFDELQTIAGIGPATAQRIVDERRKGPFKSLDDLQARVKGIGESRVRKMAAAGLTVGRAAP